MNTLFSRVSGRLRRSTTLFLVIGLLELAACESKTTVAAPESGVRVEVNDHGFQPSHVVLGSDRRILFRRTSEQTCATAVVFPEFHIEKPLPMNTDVEVVLPASAHGERNFENRHPRSR